MVGAGVLGRRVGLLWQQRRPGAKVVAATLSRKSHEELKALGFQPVIPEELKERSFKQVVFCAPPSRPLESEMPFK